MLSKARASFIISLQKKKFREEHGLYVIEGDKMVRDYIAAGMPVDTVYAKREWIASQKQGFFSRVRETVPVSYDEIRKISSMTTPHNALALVRIVNEEPQPDEITTGYVIALESVQDPGNLGTIIRAAAWFGIQYIICSADSVDCFNPKVVQASMGGLMWVRVIYTDLASFLGTAKESNLPVFGTYPDGNSIYRHNPPERGIILFGNESKGISGFLDEYVTERITIPRGKNITRGIDSLNVAMSVTIVLSELTRKLS